MKRAIFIAFPALGVLALLTAGCGSTKDCADPTSKLFVSVQPANGEAEADGVESVRVMVSGQLENCEPISSGAEIEFRISDPDPADVGFFEGGATTLTEPYGSFGISADVYSTTIGTARVSVLCRDHNLSAPPVEVKFIQPTVGGQCGVTVTAEPPVIEADGISTSEITATLTADKGGSMPDGTTVTFTTDHGKFVQSGGLDHETISAGSTATVTLQSEQSVDTLEAEVTATFMCDDGQVQSGKNSVRFGEVGQPAVHLSAVKSSVLADGVDSTALTAEVYLPGGTRAGAGVEVAFFTDAGRFTDNMQVTYSTFTDDAGAATATFQGGTVGTTATIRASVYIDSMPASDEILINVRALGAVQFVSADPDKLGVQGSGKDESSEVTFEVLDTQDGPLPDTLVEFTTTPAPGVTFAPSAARTDLLGQVSTTLSSGRLATPVTVTATASVGTVELSADSPSIAIVGAKPSAEGLTFSCEEYNVGGLVLDYVETICTAALSDRFSNKIGFATNVTFETEAGAIDSFAVTDTSTANMGLASVTIRTQQPRPDDVPPIPGEPFVGSANPRDGVVTILAVTTGEEEFTDSNGSGDYDMGEPFEDLGEPFIDADDDGERGPLEDFIDANSSMTYDPPNGVWDGETLIWTETKMLWTGRVSLQPGNDCSGNPGYSRLCSQTSGNTFNIPKGGSDTFCWEVKDANLNQVNGSATISAIVNGKGSMGTIASPTLPYNVPDRDVSDWMHGGGLYGCFSVDGADIADSTPPEQGTVVLNVNYNESPGAGEPVVATITVIGTFQ